MNDRLLTPEERAQIAAEYALGVLTGADLDHARALDAADAAFRAEVARWRGRLAPMLELAADRPAPASAWRGIDAAIGGPAVANDNVSVLRRRVSTWRGIATAMTAIAAALAIFLIVQPERQTIARPAPQAVETPLVAMLGDQADTKVLASWDPTGQRLVVAVVDDMPGDRSHAHELWVIPAGGKARSLGTMGSAKMVHMRLEDTLAALMRQGATIAISVEPPGGSPSGAPTGPVIASGALESA